MAGQYNRLVIGLDYGTTFTGVAFQAVASGQQGAVAQNLTLLNLVVTWHGTDNSDKWGASFSPLSLKLVWTKLELEQQSTPDELSMILGALHGTNNLNFSHIQQNHGLPAYPAKDAVEIVANYLSKVREKLWEELLQSFGQAILVSIPIDLVLTVPAMWSEAARDRTFRAVCKAGFDKQHFPGLRDIILVSEPEATGLALLKSLRPRFGQVAMFPGDSFVVCDTGGGTVDLISYQVKQYRPAPKIEKITLATGARCGATFIDRQFRSWLERKLGRANFKLLAERAAFAGIGSHTIVEPRMVEIMNDFMAIKHAFKGIGEPERDYIQLPAPLNRLNDPANGIRNGEICVTDHDLEQMFKFSVERTVDMILGQIGLVEHAGSRVKYVFLYGGFAESQYLYRKVDLATQMIGVKLERPESSWSAVVRGAVAKGIDRDASAVVCLRKCRRHYGVSVSQPFSEWKHSESDAYVDPFDGQKKAKDQIVWLIKKGDAVLSTEPKRGTLELRRRFGRGDPRSFRTYLVASDDDVAPQRLSQVNQAQRSIAVLNYNFEDNATGQIQAIPAVGRGQSYFMADFKIEIILEEDIEFRVSCNETVVASTKVVYAPEPEF